MADLFRKEALESISTPEQLDRQVKIMRPKAWILYAAVVLAILTALIWSVTYQVTEGMEFSGIIFTNNNINRSIITRDCVVMDVLVTEGESVEIGSILAVVSNEPLLAEITEARQTLELLDPASPEYAAASEALEELVDSYVATTMIKSSCSGTVQQIKSVGSALSAGSSVATVLSDNGYNELIAYAPLQQAGNLSLGMTAQITPSFSAREEYGYMSGIVTAIGESPVTEDSIQGRMGTVSYVQDILPEASCVEIRIRLDLDEDSPNGYRWSNEKGENLHVEMGTTCTVYVVTDEYFPAELLFS